MKKSYRIKKEMEFHTIMKQKNSYANRNFVVYIATQEDIMTPKHFRVGLSVGKKVGNAVMRNRVKRQIRESLFQMKDQIDPTKKLIVIARPNVTTLTTAEVASNLKHVFKLANII